MDQRLMCGAVELSCMLYSLEAFHLMMKILESF